MTAPVVLIVDDEVELRVELSEALQRAGMTVYCEEGPIGAAIALAAHRDITVICTDVRMEEGDGMALAESILNGRSSLEGIEVVILTGYANFEMALQAVRVRVFELLRKPARIKQVVSTIMRAHTLATERRDAAAQFQRMHAKVEEQLRVLDGSFAALSKRDNPTAHDPLAELLNDGLLNALMPVVGFSDILERLSVGALQHEGRGYANKIRVGGEKLALLIRGTTTVLALRSGKETMRPMPVAVRAIVTDLQKWFDEEAPDLSIGIRVQLNLAVMLRTDKALFILAIELLVVYMSAVRSKENLIFFVRVSADNLAMECSIIGSDGVLADAASVLPGAPSDFVQLGLAMWLAAQICGFLGVEVTVSDGATKDAAVFIRVPNLVVAV